MEENKKTLKVKRLYKPPKCFRYFFDYLIEEITDDGEHGIRIIVVVECLRALFYYGLVTTFVVGVVLTMLFVREDHKAIIMDVFGVSNICTYLDFPPATYILPIVYTFPMFSGITYSIVSIFRVSISYNENKIGRLAKILLWIAHIHFIFSLIWVTAVFAVQPDRKDPTSMIVHTLPYVNFKVAFCTLQIGVTYFGSNVSWNCLNFSKCFNKRWFVALSWIHVFFQFIDMIVSNIMIINALGDMGAEGLIGKGLQWDVHKQSSKTIMNVFANWAAFFLNFIVPWAQSQYLFTRGRNDISNTHTISFYISDNQKASQTHDFHNESCNMNVN